MPETSSFVLRLCNFFMLTYAKFLANGYLTINLEQTQHNTRSSLELGVLFMLE